MWIRIHYGKQRVGRCSARRSIHECQNERTKPEVLGPLEISDDDEDDVQLAADGTGDDDGDDGDDGDDDDEDNVQLAADGISGRYLQAGETW